MAWTNLLACGAALPALLTISCAAPLPVGSAGLDAWVSVSPTWSLSVPQADSALGASVANAGDVNGDGYPDQLIGIPGYDLGQPGEGVVALFLGSSSGPTLAPAWLREGDQAHAWLGMAVAGVGDVDGDGFDDVLVGAPGWDADGEPDVGAAWLHRGTPGGLETDASLEVLGGGADEHLGRSLAGLGDLDDNGWPDYAIGAPWTATSSGSRVGRVLVYGGGPVADLDAEPDLTLWGDQEFSGFGWSIAGAGDVRKDGFPDVLVGEPWFDGWLVDQGRAHLFDGTSTLLEQTALNQLLGPGPGSLFGASLAGDGRLGTDNHAAVAVGAPGFTDHEVGEGAVVVYLGDHSGLPSIEVTNEGQEPLTLTELAYETVGDGLTRASAHPSLPWALAPGGELSVTIRFEPGEEAAHSGVLIVRSDDPARPVATAAQTGRGIVLRPELRIEPEVIDLGGVGIDCTVIESITLSSVGTSPVTLYEFEWLTNSDELTLDATPGPGIVLEPGEEVEVDVAYTPVDYAPDVAELVVHTDEPESPYRSASIDGIGATSTRVTETFTAGGGAADLLFVMDNSGSMADQQAMMASNIDLFVSTFTSFGLDYRIATVTTDVGNGGLFRGTVPVVTPDTPNPEVAFAENVVTGIFGSDFERGFDSAYLALSNSANPDFLRENAALVLVFVSDEPEQSILLGSQTSDYVEWFQSLKSSPAELMMSDITGGEIGCSGDAGDAGPGGRYPLASAATGGARARSATPTGAPRSRIWPSRHPSWLASSCSRTSPCPRAWKS